MNPRDNPYSPGAGTKPRALAGRDDLLEKASIALYRCIHGRSHRGILLVGLRGVGKTVLLNRIAQEAEKSNFVTVQTEVPEGRSFPATLCPPLKTALLSLDAGKKLLNVLNSFVKAMKVRYKDLEFSANLTHFIEEDIFTGDLEYDLSTLLETIGKVAQQKNKGLLLAIDELQYVKKEELAALLMALHRCTQKELPVTLIGAGLPQLVGLAGKAKSYAERLLEYQKVDRLSDDQATEAIQKPAKEDNVTFTPEAIRVILEKTQGYPYFLQEWGMQCWNLAEKSPITNNDAEKASEVAISQLDHSFFQVRFDRLTKTERLYLRAMAQVSEETVKSKDIAKILNKRVQQVAPVRTNLIHKGMIYSPSHGDASFTVPLFGDFMKRQMPESTEW